MGRNRSPSIILTLLAVILLTGCQSKLALQPESRSDLRLFHFGSLVVSSPSPVSADQHYHSTTRELEYHVTLLVKNLADQTTPLLIRGAQFRSPDGGIFPAACADFHGLSDNFDLNPGQEIRLDCVIRIIATEKNHYTSHGVGGYLWIPSSKRDSSQGVRVPYVIPSGAFT